MVRDVAKSVDPITLEVVQATLVNVVREMRSTIQRTSYTSILCEALDFACGIVSSDAELVAMSEDLPLHIFAVAWHVKLAKELYGDDMNPGDLYLSNDPYTSGPHLNDVLTLKPFFANGKLRLLIAARVHWEDVGGKSRGSLTGNAREIYEEGIRVPMVKIQDRGTFNKDLMSTILANVRNPDNRWGDFEATIGALNTGEMRLQELYDKYSPPVVDQCIDTLLDRSENVVRKAVARLPDGEHYYEEYLENDGMTPYQALPMRVKMSVIGDQMTFDFTGSSPQVEGPMNGGPSMAFTGIFVMLKSLLERDTPVNGGLMRAVKLINPDGSFMNARRPAPVAGYSEVGFLVQNCVVGLFGQLLRGKIGAPSESGANHVFLAGWDPERQRHWIWYEFPWGGWPASTINDGHNCLTSYDLGDINTVLPIEKAEIENPVITLKSELRQDSGGPGYLRGGLGMIQYIKVMDPRGCLLSSLGEQAVYPRVGMAGGYPGALNEFRLIRNGKEFVPGEIPSKYANFPVEQGDILVLRVRGGGGFGDPLDRDAAKVAEDVALRYVSEEQARSAYGVILGNGSVDEEKTKELRASIKANRTYLKVKTVADDEFDEINRRLCRVSPQMANRLGVENDDLIEYVPGTTSHLKAWIRIDKKLQADESPMGPRGRQILQLDPNALLWVRPLFTKKS